MKTKCENCGKEIDRRPCRIKEHNYCNTTCQMEYEYRSGRRDRYKTTKYANESLRQKSLEKFKTNPTRRIEKRGYWLIYIPLVGWKKEHHYIWEKRIGKIPDGMCIHHINFNKLDNRIENLRLMEKKEHHKLHYAKQIIDNYGRFVPK